MGGILVIKWAVKRAIGNSKVFAHHQERAPSALLAVSGFLRTRPFNCQNSSESAHLIPKFTSWLRENHLCPDEWMADLGIDHDDSVTHDRLEERLSQLALTLLRLGQSVVLEHGFWGRSEGDQKR